MFKAEHGKPGAAAGFAAPAEPAGTPRAELPVAVAYAAAPRIGDFSGDNFRLQPVSFYSWTPELESIFRRDRPLMQADPRPSGIVPVVAIRGEDPNLAP